MPFKIFTFEAFLFFISIKSKQADIGFAKVEFPGECLKNRPYGNSVKVMPDSKLFYVFVLV